MRHRFPLWLKLAYTAFLCLLIPLYWEKYGPQNFLWFSDILLFGAAIALWTENRLLASMMAVAILPEIAWCVDFAWQIVTGRTLIHMANYMFESHRPLWLRGLSLFHVFLPVVILWMVWRLGQHRRAWLAQSILAWIVLPVTWLVTDPSKNINWVHGPVGAPQQWMAPWLYLLLVMIFLPLVAYIPTHLLLRRLFPRPRR